LQAAVSRDSKSIMKHRQPKLGWRFQKIGDPKGFQNL
jgi:hypothetical protein